MLTFGFNCIEQHGNHAVKVLCQLHTEKELIYIVCQPYQHEQENEIFNLKLAFSLI